jgi:ubiquinone/menaquinone biosynthesis C-methylase UbiE
VIDTLVRNDRSDWNLLDDAYQAYLDSVIDPPWGSLIAQTIVTGPHRRALFGSLDIQPGWTILDLGTGFGPIPLELTHIAPVRAIGIDLDRRLLEVAAATAACLEASSWRAPGASVEFLVCGGADLPLPDESVDLVTARLLFQHVGEPIAIMSEALRVLRPGGRVVTYDVDDGLATTWPPESTETALLDMAYAAMQASYGGDREIGRKLPHLFAESGFTVEQIQLFPQASYAATCANDVFRELSAARYRAGRDGMIATGVLDAALFDRCIAAFEREASVPRCRIENQIAVVARKSLG